jgi:hypothetical protein
VADRNALMAAAPDPTAAGQHAEQLALQQLQLQQRPQGGYAGSGYSNPYGSFGAGYGFGSDAQLNQNYYNMVQNNPFKTGIGPVTGGFDWMSVLNELLAPQGGGSQPVSGGSQPVSGGSQPLTMGLDPSTGQPWGGGGSFNGFGISWTGAPDYISYLGGMAG